MAGYAAKEDGYRLEISNRWIVLETKTKVIVKLICAFVFAYAKTRFSHDAAHITQFIYTLSLLFRL